MYSFLKLSCKAKRTLSLNSPKKNANTILPPLTNSKRNNSVTYDQTSTVITSTFSPKIKCQSPKFKPFSVKQNTPLLKLSCCQNKSLVLKNPQQEINFKSDELLIIIGDDLKFCGFKSTDTENSEFTLEQYLQKQ